MRKAPSCIVLLLQLRFCGAFSLISRSAHSRSSTALESKTEQWNRRDVLQTGGVSLPFFASRASLLSAAAASSTNAEETTGAVGDNGLLADLPMRRLHLPQGGLGREYMLIPIWIDNKGPFEFMVDTGLTTELITPHLQRQLGITVDTNGVSSLQGIGAGGTTTASTVVPIKGASFCNGECPGERRDELKLPNLSALVMDFPQEHMDPAHDPVEGMLGMEALSLLDVDFDFEKERIRFWAPGTAASASKAAQDDLVEIPAAVLNDSGLVGIRIVSAKHPQDQPFVGIVDCGSAFSSVNWAAANLLRLPAQTDRYYQNQPAVMALGMDGRPMKLPTMEIQLTFAGNASKNPETGQIVFEQPPSIWRTWEPIRMAVGDLPAFSDLLGDGRTPYKGPAALIGMDILSQKRRVILEANATQGRTRKLWLSPS